MWGTKPIFVKSYSDEWRSTKNHESTIDVAKPSTNRVHNVANRNVLPKAIAGNQGIQLLNVSTCHNRAFIQGPPRTLSGGGPPVGYWRKDTLELVCQLSLPPPNAFLLLEFRCCQSYQTLSIIYARNTSALSPINRLQDKLCDEGRTWDLCGRQRGQLANARSELQLCLPFEDHFIPIPRSHSGGSNPNGHLPPISPPRMRCAPG